MNNQKESLGGSGFEELNYLRELNRKYPYRLKQYFGFSLKDFVQELGVLQTFFTEVLSGKRNLPEKYREKFIEIFNRLEVKNKTINFKESNLQKIVRELRERTR